MGTSYVVQKNVSRNALDRAFTDLEPIRLKASSKLIARRAEHVAKTGPIDSRKTNDRGALSNSLMLRWSVLIHTSGYGVASRCLGPWSNSTIDTARAFWSSRDTMNSVNHRSSSAFAPVAGIAPAMRGEATDVQHATYDRARSSNRVGEQMFALVESGTS
jgi:hypothetical protein